MPRKEAAAVSSTSLTPLEAAKAVVVDAEKRYAAARDAKERAFHAYVKECLPYIARIPNIYEHLAPSVIVDVMGSLERIVSVIGRLEPLAVKTNESHTPEQRAEKSEQLPYNQMSPGQKAAYTRMSPGRKAAYTKRMRKEKAEAAAAETAPSEVVSYDGEKAQELREKLGYTRRELGKILELSPHYIIALESGQSQVSENPRGTKMKRYFQWYQKNIGA